MHIKFILVALIIFTFYLGRINAPSGYHVITLGAISLGAAFVTLLIYTVGKVIALEWHRFASNDIKLVVFEKLIIPAMTISYPFNAISIFYVEKGEKLFLNLYSNILLIILFFLLADIRSKARKAIFDYRPNLMANEQKMFSRYPPKTTGDMFVVILAYSLIMIIPVVYRIRHS